MKQTAISARINSEVLQYCKANGGKLNTLINQLLESWMKKNQQKQMLIFQEETGTDDLSQMAQKQDLKCSQCCNNCIHKIKDECNKIKIIFKNIVTEPPFDEVIYRNADPKTFCCIYWEKKKGGK